MTTQPDRTGELIPRPEQTPAALRAALAVVAPERLAEMDASQRAAVTEAIEQSGITPLRMFLIQWAAVIEIERFPDTARELRRAEYLAQIAEDPEESRRYVRAAGDIIRAAHKAVGG
ncbi:hypothetical protein EDD98_7072 [Streptomyces sp. PanSC19]|uniref:hypothetical protein n=1 Tax=Streptomyces sp. PanSC19 TaxID=1520455 RepID=UPI000F468AF8|nr:hypothetical protein [Streptomyces sp. PanSC19]ROQ24464.1 hypothetical protein EDD98_7072 [Streptomyces sp. PanSC19]